MTRYHALGIGGCLLIMAVIVGLGPYSSPAMFLPDQGASWYYWKLPEPDFFTRFVAWSFYGLHQASMWWLIASAQRQRPGYTQGLHRINRWALAINALFVALHIFQTRWTYDGLAQDVSVWSSQFSVIFMLVFILIMENKRRGLLFGKKVGWFEEPGRFLRRYHGYYFSWAIIYTFWFHPIEDNMGHLLGTFYTLMILLQGSLFFTRFHTNRWWTLLLEVFVLLHGAVVAYMTQDSGVWRMFLFGFFGLLVVTQMHGVGLSRAARWLVVALYFVTILVSYWGSPEKIPEVLNIPAAELGLAFLCAGLILWFLRTSAGRKLQPPD
ncbi:MAG: hypothetical protein KDI33_13330 [Halioglobus sp.]|nr:hypothetical protein [Halioglobus sp.]